MRLGFDLFYSADRPGGIAWDLRNTGTCAPEETEFIRRHLKAGSVFVDIGARAGYFSILAARIVGSSGRVISVEPDPANVRLLRLNKALLPCPDTLEIVNAAAGEVNGWTRLYRPKLNTGKVRTSTTSAGIPSSGGGQGSIGIAVEVRRMDDLLAEVSHVDLVKVDASGLDYAALRSMEGILRRDQPAVMFEFRPTALEQAGHSPNEFRDMLLRLGYKYEPLGGTNVSSMPPELAQETVVARIDGMDRVVMNGPTQSRTVRDTGRHLTQEHTKALATMGSGPMAPVLDLTLPFFEGFARRHGYQLVVGDGETRGRPAAWGKVLLMRRLLDEFDDVLWIDADALVLDDTVDLSAAIRPECYQALARIVTNEGDIPNTGVWFLRGDTGRRLLDAIWQAESYVEHKWWEGAALLDLLGFSLTPPVQLVRTTGWAEGTQWLDPEWNAIPPWVRNTNARIRHYAGMSNVDRMQQISTDLHLAQHRYKIVARPSLWPQSAAPASKG